MSFVVEQCRSTKVEVYKPGSKTFFVFGQDNKPVVPDESQVFSLGEIISYGQFPDIGIFNVVETEDGIKLIMQTTERIFLKDEEAQILKNYKADETFEYPISSTPLALMSLKTRRQIVITLDPEPPDEILVGAKPIDPDPSLSESVALKTPLIPKPPMRSPHFVVGYPKKQGN